MLNLHMVNIKVGYWAVQTCIGLYQWNDIIKTVRLYFGACIVGLWWRTSPLSSRNSIFHSSLLTRHLHRQSTELEGKFNQLKLLMRFLYFVEIVVSSSRKSRVILDTTTCNHVQPLGLRFQRYILTFFYFEFPLRVYAIIFLHSYNSVYFP